MATLGCEGTAGGAPGPGEVAAASNQPPAVDAGADQTLTLPTASLTLHGVASDSDGTIASFSWTERSGPAATLAGASTPTLSLSGLVQGTYVFRLTATDDRGASSFDEAQVVVNARPPAPWLVGNGDAVFFVGNSFFGWENRVLPDWVAAIGQASRPAFALETGSHIVFGNNPLSWFLQQPASQDAIASGHYKVFVLQGEEREPVEHKADFQQAVRDYHRAITARGGKVVLFMTWDFSWDSGTTFFSELSASYEEIGRELGIPVIPVGLIYQDCDAQPFAGEPPYWLTAQGLHPTEAGAAVDAYATFQLLTGTNPAGVQFTAAGNTNSPELLRYLSDKAWLRVAPRLTP